MPVEIKVPQMGESVVEATVARWLKQEGEPVTPGDVLVELETDKVNLEVSAEQGGVLAQIGRREGETVSVGDVIGLVSGTEEAGNGHGASAPEAAPPAAAGGEVAAAAPPQEAAGQNGAQATEGTDRAGAVASPVAKRLAEDNDLDLRLVKGSGSGGRITKEDVANYIERRDEAPATANTLAQKAVEPAPVGQTPASPGVAEPLRRPPTAPTTTTARNAAPAAAAPQPVGAGRPEERIRMSRRRQTIATRLVEAQRTAAMLTTFNEIDMTTVMDVRKRRKDAFKERHGVNLGFMSFFAKAVIGALKAFPYLNAEIQGDEIVVKRYYDIGVAVSTEEGLVVPVVRDADRKSFAQIEREIADLAVRAREGKLTLPDLQGGTFTVTNGGVFGSLLSTPILNAPQVGILGMHAIEERPVVKDSQIVIRPMMYVALSYDHRIVDGSEAVRFLVRVKELIQDPESLLLEG